MEMPKQTLAAILVEQKKPLEIARIDLPRKIEVGQVLVKLAYSGICGSQIGEMQGVKGSDPWLPHLLGHEGSGQVLFVGAGVKHVKPLDHVILHWRPSRGIESEVPKYHWNNQVINAGWVTTFNEYAVVSENRLTKIEAGTNLKTAALYGCAITTGFGVVDNLARVRLGETVVVFGAGGVGLNVVQAAFLSGARQVIAVDIYDHRLVLAKHCGATHCINANKQNSWEEIHKILNGVGLDIFIDNTGQTEIIARAYDLVSSRGRVVLVGVPAKNQKTSLYTLPLHFGKKIVGTHGGETIPHEDIPRYMNLLKSRQVDLENIITEVGTLDDINSMIDAMRSGKSSGRCIVKF